MRSTRDRLHLALALALFAPLGAAVHAQSVLYVDASAPPAGDGSSWIQAFDDLQLALDAARGGSEIWVADGVYRPSALGDPPDPRSASFNVPSGVALFGGFAGHETSIAKRAKLFDATLLDGDLGVPGYRGDNAYQVVEIKHGGFVELNGFTVKNGNGLGSPLPVNRGAGVAVGGFSAALIANCTLRDNSAEVGAAISVVSLSSLALKNCVVRDNVAEVKGGGLYCMTSYVTSFNTLWHHNKSRNNGGAVFVTSTDIGSGGDMVRFVNDVFHDNKAARGGAIWIAGSKFVKGGLAATCCTIAFNHADAGGGIFAQTTTKAKAELRLVNSIVWNNTARVDPQIAGRGATVAVLHSDVAGGFAGIGNIAADPLFVNAGARDFRLRSGSPANDAGHTGMLVPDALDIDGDGDTSEMVPLDFGATRRLTFDPLAPDLGVPLEGSPIVDMGAFEL